MSDERVAIRRAAMNYLARREYSIKELVDKLSKKELSSEAIELVVSELEQENLVSDERFVESFVRSKINSGQGPNKIRMGLQEKKVSENLINQHLGYDADIDWEKVIGQAYNSRYGERPIQDFDDRSKRMRFLYQRGFPSDLIDFFIKSCPVQQKTTFE